MSRLNTPIQHGQIDILPEIIEVPSSSSTTDRAELDGLELDAESQPHPKSESQHTIISNEFEIPSQSMTCTNQEAFEPKLSYTERLSLREYDFLEDFPIEIPAYSALSQDSIRLSDDEINYSMNKYDDRSNRYVCDDIANDHDERSNEIEAFETVAANESDENLVNRSVCDILEKTFVQNTSIAQTQLDQSTRPTRIVGGKSVKRIHSESALAMSAVKQNLININPAKSTCSQHGSRFLDEMIDLSDDEYIIKVGSVSQKPNYDTMDCTELELELRKFGLKPSLKRRQAIICLEYIYNRTHPTIKNVSMVDSPVPMEKVKSPTSSQSTLNFNIGFAAHDLSDEKFKTASVERFFLPSPPRAKVSGSYHNKY